MDILPLHIEYLLTRHDCVIVPGIGAFIATETAASIDLERGVISPRRREISFNSSVVTDDGLLTHSIARHEEIQYEEARRMMNAFIEKMNSDLKYEGEASVGMIGRLIRDSEGMICFQPRVTAATSDILPDIRLEERKEEIVTSLAEENVNTSENIEDENKIRIVEVPADRYVFTISKRAVHAAAMLITILTIGLSLMIPINHDNEQKASVISIEEFFHHKVNPVALQKPDSAATINENDSVFVTETTAAF